MPLLNLYSDGLSTHPVQGHYITYDFMKDEFRKMKELNINTIRTSHYPPHHKFLELRDEMGFYENLIWRDEE